MRPDRSQRGITMMEVLFVLMVLGVVTTMAYPNLYRQVTYSRRTEAFLGLGSIVRAQKKFFDLNRRYTDQFQDLDFSMSHGSQIGPSAYRAGRYVFSLEILDDRSEHFMAIATGEIDGDVFTDMVVALR